MVTEDPVNDPATGFNDQTGNQNKGVDEPFKLHAQDLMA